MNRMLTAATLVVAGAWTLPAKAENPTNEFEPEQRTAPTGCTRPSNANSIVRCALAASPEIREARAQLAAGAGRRTTADVWLPSNPTIAGTLAQRRRPAPENVTVLNWSVTLSQELEIAGQRGVRLAEVDAMTAAQQRRVTVAEQEVAAGALTAYYEAVASQELLRFARELAETAQALATYAGARAKEALAAGIEVDVARAEATRIGLVRLEAERRLGGAQAALAVLLDVEASALVLPDALPVIVPIDLSKGHLEEEALRLRSEIAAAEMERQVLERRLTLVRRERVPNPTVSAFIERGEIDDRIIGVGLSVPLPLPSPVGRTRAGEIAETLARIRAAESSEDLVRRRVRLEVARALAALKASNAAIDLFAGDLLTRARADVSALREAIASRQLTLREGLQWQRSLIELLQADIETRLAQAIAAVELRRVVGLPLASTRGDGR
jgi:cobalt-zinc-cadmium efflux system outer membrane protein